MPRDTPGADRGSLLALGETVQQLLLAAEQGRWDDLADMTGTMQAVLDQYVAVSAQGNLEQASGDHLTGILAACDRLKHLCQERKEQIAPFVEKLERATLQSR